MLRHAAVYPTVFSTETSRSCVVVATLDKEELSLKYIDRSLESTIHGSRTSGHTLNSKTNPLLKRPGTGTFPSYHDKALHDLDPKYGNMRGMLTTHTYQA